MRLSELLRQSDADTGAMPPMPRDPEIVGITADSRAARAGWLFVALAGGKADGAAFARQAVAAGAVAVLAGESADLSALPEAVVVVRDREPRRRLARLAAAFAGQQPRVIVAVTGTSGKTSVAEFARQMFAGAGFPAASLGTLGIVSPVLTTPPGLTTPDPVLLHRDLAALAHGGVHYVAMEASSHGLDQHRLDGVRFAAAAFTNLSRDHLDYHPSMDAYLAAKRRLFSDLMSAGATAVINADSPHAQPLIELSRQRQLRLWCYGLAGDELRLDAARPHGDGQHLALTLFGRRYEVDLPLIGAFMAGNALAALGLTVAVGVPVDSALATMAKLKGAPGRLERVATHRAGAPVLVDYAHKPDALEQVLRALRPHTHGRLIVVFGCGGDRDPGKRPIMGDIAARLADVAIVTDDNPRSEDPAAIRAAIMAGVTGGTASVVEVKDGRRAAIRAGLDAVRGPDDLVVIAGKGHEQGQTISGVTHPFDDAVVARELTAAPSARGAAA
ncbi:UDP-N-acetylmuramoyl-L-alanyl-D-glutamate--2,6-diaminopimelate ligase [Vineibacter terrae]|uniref:UDP-N-acetylmuramoyl-L-alanyl-D-glutamate--2, 6-diaminopimelate ligase n=1 Tax=Vineibacter terrae TaxID=2586908 RepID=UPI002E31F102|nr:UDP-N-acetylmuramoyl-L-alanyl-D-glutamate--2,6-diaminopimelate ligase [Vineibacter terrae]HEX2887965.1 UDP-N-acetylmuramoyl-L-alanyl-D-glutamate--2,6-diaminopimelate ligase [Vineibacter terrae]